MAFGNAMPWRVVREGTWYVIAMIMKLPLEEEPRNK